MKTKTTLALLATLSLSGLIGCQTDQSSLQDFFPDKQERKVNQFVDSQTTAGARQDAMLQDCHFTGGKVNSLGESKLDLMMPDEQDADLWVYVNLPAGEMTTARKDSVSDYLHYRGLDASHVKMVDGPNPNTLSPAAPGVAALVKTETSSEETPATGASGSGASSSTMK